MGKEMDRYNKKVLNEWALERFNKPYDVLTYSQQALVQEMAEVYETENKRNTPPYALRYIPFWLYQKGMKNEIIDPHGMGRETADSVAHFSKNKEDILRVIDLVEKESKQTYFTPQIKTYYKSLIEELKSYAKMTESNLDLYRK